MNMCSKISRHFALVLLMIYFSFNLTLVAVNQKASPLYKILKSTVRDYDGNQYRTVRIGNQVWMAENLRVTHYRDGSEIPLVIDDDKWSKALKGAYCPVENNGNQLVREYGLLYNFYAVRNDCQLCPKGWRVPTKADCLTLIEYLGGSEVAGTKIKDNRSGLWSDQDAEANNSSGFSGLPSGGRGRLGPAAELGRYATWWSSTVEEPNYAWHWGVFPNKPGIRSNPGHMASGFSVRCIRVSVPKKGK